ncbi:hypothetical protein BH09PAT2_BH09PAT2_00500 [soil metagenome]
MKVPVKIPENSELLIQTGQKVDFDTPFIQKKGRKQLNIPLARTLNFKPEKIFLVLKKVIGDRVKKGELLAENKAFLSTKQYFAEADGIIAEVNHNTGSLVLEIDTEDSQIINCFFTGDIEAIHDDHIEIGVKKMKKFETLEHINDYGGAQVFYLINQGPCAEEDVENRYVCTTVIDPLAHIKIEAFGAQGYITDTKKSFGGNIKQIVLQNPEDFQDIHENKYPYCIVGLDNTSIYLYE